MEFKYRVKELKTFFFWMNERHNIWVKRKARENWPWTKDKILQTYKFTNVFRQLDRVTECWTDRWMRLLGQGKNMTNGEILFQLCVFRFFNWPETYDTLYFNMRKWDVAKAIELLRKRKEEDFEQIFTGAYIVTGGGKGEPKHETICNALQYLWERKNNFAKYIFKHQSMAYAVSRLQEIPTVGPFIAYEIVCDLSHTRILIDAIDRGSWANPGPGAKRGIHRLLTGHKEIPSKGKPDYNEVMRDLLAKFKTAMSADIKNCVWPFEMREIEHSLCEYDKFRRVQNGEGKPRSLYHAKLNDDMFEEKLPWI